jgi:hypothetical protein
MRKCDGISRSGEKCYKYVLENEKYCKTHMYLKTFTPEQIQDIRDGNGKQCNKCGAWLADKNETRCPKDKLLDEKSQEKRKQEILANKCEWVDRHKQPCRNGKINGTNYCVYHDFVIVYTDQMKTEATFHSVCNQFTYHNEEVKCHCLEARNERKQELITLKENSEFVACKKCGIGEGKYDGYCHQHRTKGWKLEAEKDGTKKVCRNYDDSNIICRNTLNINDEFDECEECRAWRQEIEDKKYYSATKNHTKAYNDKKLTIDYKYYTYTNNAKIGEKEWKLTLEQCRKLFTDNCYYCGSAAMEGLLLNGIDRKDSLQGYLVDNCVSCCGMCNRMKLDELDDKQFISSCEHILVFHEIIDGTLYPDIFPDHYSNYYSEYKSKCNQKEIDFFLTQQDFFKIVNNNCYICNKSNSDMHNNGIDRLHCFIGYQPNNCKACCGRCNKSKNDFDLYQYFYKLLKIYKYHKNQTITEDEINNLKDLVITLMKPYNFSLLKPMNIEDRFKRGRDEYNKKKMKQKDLKTIAIDDDINIMDDEEEIENTNTNNPICEGYNYESRSKCMYNALDDCKYCGKHKYFEDLEPFDEIKDLIPCKTHRKFIKLGTSCKDCKSDAEKRKLNPKPNDKNAESYCKGIDINDKECRNHRINGTLYCKYHCHMINYTEEEIKNMETCTTCRKKVFKENGYCPLCHAKNEAKKEDTNKKPEPVNVTKKDTPFPVYKMDVKPTYSWKDDVDDDNIEEVVEEDEVDEEQDVKSTKDKNTCRFCNSKKKINDRQCCTKHDAMGFLEDTKKNNPDKKVCSGYRRKCRNTLDKTDKYMKCETCRAEAREKEKANDAKHALKAVSNDKEKTCDHCHQTRPLSMFIGVNKETTVYCSVCKDIQKKSDAKRSGRPDRK